MFPSLNLLKEVKKYKSISFHEIYNSMKDGNDIFAFLYSQRIFSLTTKERHEIFNKIISISNDVNTKTTIEFLIFSFKKLDYYWDNAKSKIEKVSSEDILTYMEFVLLRMLNKNKSLDNKNYPREIIYSQYDFLLGTIPIVFKFIKENDVLFLKKNSFSKNEKCKEILESLSHYCSIFESIAEVLRGFYIPKPSTFIEEKYGFKLTDEFDSACKFFLQRSNDNFDTIETYRDLNYQHEQKNENDHQKLLHLMKKSKSGNYYDEIGLFHINMAKSDDFEEELYFHKVCELLAIIYGSVNTEFRLNNLTFKLLDLVNLARAIHKIGENLLKTNSNNDKTKKSKSICIVGHRSLLRKLNISKNLHALIDLFLYDFEMSNPINSHYYPIFKIKNLYYIMPSHITNLCYEKTIDKIISNNNSGIEIKSNAKKGNLFEKSIIDLFNENGYTCESINPDQHKGIPEIDALIEFDENTILLVEAKCTIKPEQRIEVFNYVENHLSKAIDQLCKRYTFLTEKTKEAEKRISFKIEGKSIIPIIVTNHSYFTGEIITTPINIHCIDIVLLNKIIKERYILNWHYSTDKDSYFKKDTGLKNSKELLNAILYPTTNLKSKARKTIQILEYGMAFEISKNPVIDWLYEYNTIAKN